MRLHTLPDDQVIDLDQVINVGKLFHNKNDSQYDCYEVYFSNGTSIGLFEAEMPRANFIIVWNVG